MISFESESFASNWLLRCLITCWLTLLNVAFKFGLEKLTSALVNRHISRIFLMCSCFAPLSLLKLVINSSNDLQRASLNCFKLSAKYTLQRSKSSVTILFIFGTRLPMDSLVVFSMSSKRYSSPSSKCLHSCLIAGVTLCWLPLADLRIWRSTDFGLLLLLAPEMCTWFFF